MVKAQPHKIIFFLIYCNIAKGIARAGGGTVLINQKGLFFFYAKCITQFCSDSVAKVVELFP